MEATDLISLSAGREIFWNVSHIVHRAALYALLLVSTVVFLVGCYSRIAVWLSGKPSPARGLNLGRRTWIFVRDVIFQSSVNDDEEARAFHSLMFLGFLVLTFTTTMVFIDQDLGIKIYQGPFYLFVTLLSDLFGFGFIVAVFLAIYRRYVLRPDRLHSAGADSLLLSLLLLMLIQGFALEGLRIRATTDPWAFFSPIGYLFGEFFWGLSKTGLLVVHRVIWWFHSLTVLFFIAVIPYTKFFHVLASGLNIFFKSIDRPKGALASPGDLEGLLENATEDFSIGVTSIKDTSWKQRLDFDACTSCGRCQNVCPAYNSGKPLSPKWLILDSRNHLLTLQAKDELQESRPKSKARTLLSKLFQSDRFLLSKLLLRNQANSLERGQNKAVQKSALSIGESAEHSLAGEVMDENVFWSCTTCRACMEVCPVGIEHVDYIVDVRRAKALMAGELPSEAQSALKAIQARGNPFAAADSRFDWAKGLNIKVLVPGDQVDVLYWVGCIGAFDIRKQNIARSMVQILNRAGVSWGVLGNREHCTGDPARRLGEEAVFQQCAKKNINTLNSIFFKTLVTHCPHCFNTIKNEYPQFGNVGSAPTRILHHSEYISELMAANRLPLTTSLADQQITFHDPCYLGRYNDKYLEPREVLVQIGGNGLIEMSDHREKSLCCGAGGGHYWMDLKLGERINVKRIEQAFDTGAKLVGTACPFCLHMLEDGAKLKNLENEIKIRDIAELVAENLV